MSNPNTKPQAPPAAVPLAPMVPINPSATSYTRFITSFEASEHTDWIDESQSWKKTCYIGDWSQALKLRVRGREAKPFLEYLSTNHWPDFKQYTAKHSIMCRDDGNVMGEGLVMKLADDDFIYTSGPGVMWAEFQFHHGRRRFDCSVEIVTDEWYLFQIQGPESIRVMEAATKSSITDLKFLHAKWMDIDGMQFLALRQGVSGERGYELWGRAEEGQAVYKAIVDAGKAFGIRQLGMRAKLVNHAEASVPTPVIDFLPAIHGTDAEITKYREYLASASPAFDLTKLPVHGSYTTSPAAHQRTPLDLGWDRIVRISDTHDFIGKPALAALVPNPPNRFVTLAWNDEDVSDVFASLFRDETYDYMEMPRFNAMVGDAVFVDGKIVGCAVSRCYSYSFRKMLSHCIIESEYADKGTAVEVKWGGGSGGPYKMIRAVVSNTPYKEDKRKGKIQPSESVVSV